MPAAPMQRSLMMYAAADIVMEKIRAATPYHSLEAVQHIGARYPVIFWPCVSFQRQVSLAPTRQHSTPLVQAARPARRSNACHISATRTRVCHRHCMPRLFCLAQVQRKFWGRKVWSAFHQSHQSELFPDHFVKHHAAVATARVILLESLREHAQPFQFGMRCLTTVHAGTAGGSETA